MAFLRDIVSVLMVCMSYQAVLGYPQNANTGAGFPAPEQSNEQSPTVQSFSKLSTSCQLAASSLLGGSFGQCADLMGLVSIMESKDSIISPINDWVSQACSSAPCDQQALGSASEIIKSGCQIDLQEQSVAAVTIYSIITHYKQTRDMFCTQLKADGSFCLPSVLGNVEAQSGEKITVSEVISLIAGKLTRADRAFLSVSKEAYCTDCGQAVVSQSAIMIDAIAKDPAGIIFDYDFISNDTVHKFTDVCGPSFGDKALPATVRIAEPKSEDSPQEDFDNAALGSQE
ncbi:hypothetical protein PTTG_09502 [Puccinia triticina 1-1 BBBD Race 1]|uniref:Saposin B-type domain-containing protein n=2 Tax=Puccinia triticina TaxID=208348 RepID=A0A0C4F8K4_PUCT1|nr:uncharacterized protein PtA15_10A458 [Puccinia triticina]OAV98050.1 hypothetical protein PTTG_09502 [Puccinia triticina 1-1 BBBD Race 1]WAQ89035.1 hypothetical protein PtA15_10A458 [Puccinia triticina]WAR59095.1 hypothetical protein PtB15_10B437 [Puccinia triticina]